MMKQLSWISRILVGALFIISGLIKANDAIGFSYKLEEYFTVFETLWMIPYALFLAAFICVLEIILGVAVIFGTRMVTVSWLLLLMIVFFTFLTFYSAYFNKVTDCGCFGDALKLTPWQSFTKDVVLLFFVGIIFIDRKNISHKDLKSDIINSTVALVLISFFSLTVINWTFPIWFSAGLLFATVMLKQVMTKMPNTIVLGLSGLLSAYFTYYCLNHLPIKDFRPYAIGKNILAGMQVPEGAPKDSVVMTFKYKKGEQVFEFAADKLPEDLDQYEFVDRFDKVIVKGYVPPIHDFTITNADGSDYTEDILTSEDYIFMLVAYDFTKTNVEVQGKINDFVKQCDAKKVKFIGLTSTAPEDTDKLRHEYQSMFEYYFCDATTLKTIIRSNPGLLLLKKGTVVDMWHFNDWPSFEEVNQEYLKK
ncbi:MAG TPA: DoxX family protein [Bacteroidia bacterium]|nr:DoxX family protein [Bacteroidia bacterium]